MIPFGDILELAPRELVGCREFPIMSITMHNGLVDQDEKFKKRIASTDLSTYKVVRRGNLVVGFPIDEGVLGFQQRYEASAVSPAYDIWIVSGKHEVDRNYLERIFRSPSARVVYASKMRFTTNRRRVIPKDIFKQIPFPLPPLDEQKRIAAILDAADALRAKRRESIAQLDALLQSTFLDMFGDPVTNPMEWEMGVIGDLLESMKYGTSKRAESDTGDYPVLRMNNITYSGDWNFTNLKYADFTEVELNKYLVFKGHILFNRTNSKELVGKTAVYRRNEPMAFAGYLVRGITNQYADPEYIGAFMNTPKIKIFLQNKCKSIVGMANINAKEFQAIPIPKPPLDLQRRFASIVEAAERQKTRMRAHLDELDVLFASLQSRAFNGEL